MGSDRRENIIDVGDERAKILAQILTNDKALAILHSIEEEPKSISQIAEELGFPMSTVSYHIDRMLKVGLIEIAGKKYGKKLQEVKLYRASNRPILIVPRREAKRVERRLPSLERLHVISLSIASLVSAGVYLAARRFLALEEAISGSPNPTNNTSYLYGVTSTPSKFPVSSENSSVTAGSPLQTITTTNVTNNSINNSTEAGILSNPSGHLPLYLSILTFIVVFFTLYWLMRRKSKTFLRE